MVPSWFLNGNTEGPIVPKPICDVPNPNSLLVFCNAIKFDIYIYIYNIIKKKSLKT